MPTCVFAHLPLPILAHGRNDCHLTPSGAFPVKVNSVGALHREIIRKPYETHDVVEFARYSINHLDLKLSSFIVAQHFAQRQLHDSYRLGFDLNCVD